MTTLDSLPDLDIHDEDSQQNQLVPEVKVPDADPALQTEQSVVTNYPKTILVKKQAKPLLWHAPEQDFHIARHQINPADTNALEAFIEQNIPKDSVVRLQSLKFIEDVMWNRTTEHTSKVFYNDGKNKSFIISFLF